MQFEILKWKLNFAVPLFIKHVCEGLMFRQESFLSSEPAAAGPAGLDGDWNRQEHTGCYVTLGCMQMTTQQQETKGLGEAIEH